MTVKPVILRELAHRDIEAAVGSYLAEAGAATTLRFIDAVEIAIAAIGRHPGAGSPRYAHEFDVPGLRGRSLRRFPYLVFCLERDDHVDLWRVLHAHRDIPAWLQAPEG